MKLQLYTIWASVPKADWLPSDGLSWANKGTYRAPSAYSAIEQAAADGYFVKIGDKITPRDSKEIIIKQESTQ
jgi:hypothetical protein